MTQPLRVPFFVFAGLDVRACSEFSGWPSEHRAPRAVQELGQRTMGGHLRREHPSRQIAPDRRERHVRAQRFQRNHAPAVQRPRRGDPRRSRCQGSRSLPSSLSHIVTLAFWKPGLELDLEAFALGPSNRSEFCSSWSERAGILSAAFYRLLFSTPREMAIPEIDCLVERFALSARKAAHEAGFEWVELHAGRGCVRVLSGACGHPD